MQEYFVDLHVHIGRSSLGKITKRVTSDKLTFNKSLRSLSRRDSGNRVVDCVSPWIIRDIRAAKCRELDELPEEGWFIVKI